MGVTYHNAASGGPLHIERSGAGVSIRDGTNTVKIATTDGTGLAQKLVEVASESEAPQNVGYLSRLSAKIGTSNWAEVSIAYSSNVVSVDSGAFTLNPPDCATLAKIILQMIHDNVTHAKFQQTTGG